MRDSSVPRRTRRRGFVAVFLVLTTALVAAMANVASAKLSHGPFVPAAGVGSKAALESENCGPDGKLAYPYQQRAPCTRPLKQGESNGGATSTGVTGKTIKIVLFIGTHDQQEQGRSIASPAPKDRATGTDGYVEDAYHDWNEVLAHSFNTWGREFEFEIVTPSGSDEAAQRADALNVAERKPFAVVVSVPSVGGNAVGGGQVFASELVARKIIVFAGGITNAEADKQAPYRWLGGMDANAAAVNGVQFAARQLKGETAKWSGDFTDKKRVFGAIHPERGIDWQYFTSTAKKEGLQLADGADLVFSVPLNTSETAAKQQEEAPTLTAKLKDAGVTTVFLFASYTMNGQMFKAADALDYYPEWIFPGYAASDIEITARLNNSQYPEQMKHVFGLGTLQPYVEGLEDPQVSWFNWYWGPNQGVYAAGPVAATYNLYAGVSLAGPKLTPETFRQGLCSYPAYGGAASGQVVTFMFGYCKSAGLPYNEYSQVGLDYAIIWWNPTAEGKGKIAFDEGVGRFMYIDGAKRYYAGQWKKGEPVLFDESNSIAQFDSMPESDVAPEYPCTGCPGATS
jgi:hypothetical protein